LSSLSPPQDLILPRSTYSRPKFEDALLELPLNLVYLVVEFFLFGAKGVRDGLDVFAPGRTPSHWRLEGQSGSPRSQKTI